MRASITGAFGVPRETENGGRVVEFCAEKENVERMDRDRIAKRVYVGSVLIVAQWIGCGRNGFML